MLQVAEDLLAEGDSHVENFIQVGFFESIQNASTESVPQERFEPFLGPRSMAIWLELNNLWGGSTTAE